MKMLRLSMILLCCMSLFACSSDDDSSGPGTSGGGNGGGGGNNPGSTENEIEITYKVEADGYSVTKVSGEVEYADASGVQSTTIDEPWEKTVMVPRGHNLYFRVNGNIEQGTVVVKATAVDQISGKVLYTDQISENTPWGTNADFDFILEGKNLGN